MYDSYTDSSTYSGRDELYTNKGRDSGENVMSAIEFGLALGHSVVAYEDATTTKNIGMAQRRKRSVRGPVLNVLTSEITCNSSSAWNVDNLHPQTPVLQRWVDHRHPVDSSTISKSLCSDTSIAALGSKENQRDCHIASQNESCRSNQVNSENDSTMESLRQRVLALVLELAASKENIVTKEKEVNTVQASLDEMALELQNERNFHEKTKCDYRTLQAQMLSTSQDRAVRASERRRRIEAERLANAYKRLYEAYVQSESGVKEQYRSMVKSYSVLVSENRQMKEKIYRNTLYDKGVKRGVFEHTTGSIQQTSNMNAHVSRSRSLSM